MSVAKKFVTSTIPASGVTYKHRRNPQGVAFCGCPAKQVDLTDDLEDVNCPCCWQAMRSANG